MSCPASCPYASTEKSSMSGRVRATWTVTPEGTNRQKSSSLAPSAGNRMPTRARQISMSALCGNPAAPALVRGRHVFPALSNRGYGRLGRQSSEGGHFEKAPPPGKMSAHAREPQRMPDDRLICRDDRLVHIFFQSRDHFPGAKRRAGDQHGFGVRHVGFFPQTVCRLRTEQGAHRDPGLPAERPDIGRELERLEVQNLKTFRLQMVSQPSVLCFPVRACHRDPMDPQRVKRRHAGGHARGCRATCSLLHGGDDLAVPLPSTDEASRTTRVRYRVGMDRAEQLRRRLDSTAVKLVHRRRDWVTLRDRLIPRNVKGHALRRKIPVIVITVAVRRIDNADTSAPSHGWSSFVFSPRTRNRGRRTA